MVSQSAMLVCLGALVATAAGSGDKFLGAKHKVNSAAAKAELDSVLDEVLGQGHGLGDARLRKIHKTLDPLFRALPKNWYGHVSAPVMRYAVRRYFSQTHGWIVRGFNAYDEQGQSSIGGDSDMLQSKLPGYIRSLLEDRYAKQGFPLDAVAALVATLERMAFDEVVRGVELAYWLNDMDRYQAVDKNSLKEVISSFLIVEMLEGTENKTKHKKEKARIHRRYPHWGSTILFLQDLISDDVFQRHSLKNPFTNIETFSFEDATRISERISEEFGSWSNHECHEMKDMLMEMDTYGTGRVKLSEFYGYSKDGAWQFLEPSEQLRQGGALDESSTWLGPQVMIPNYINAMSNCITSQPYYQICCLNECDHVFQQLETHIAAPSATVSEVIKALESGVYAPTSISDLQRERLDEIALVHNGKIPIYGRLFARWLHFVYPHECPYPHAEGVVKPMTQREWKELVGVKAESATDDEIAQHLGSDYARRAPSADAGATMWSLEESLLDQSEKAGFSIWALLRIAVQISMLAGFVSLIRPLMQMLRSDVQGQKAVQYDV
eukprot:gnl/MRDRNA2_/MRDRNA2_86492_c0_seq17.p1 gnl/MRDRNA2_/MRDRNA2_86492_c0~~gnl/MRDRNA2_/MRDRNA2_86492_c0_seq17.p1  ORF type:complete len:552 (+),score=112.98 gnl/MRDRNA2_/MRDRNA2_86492_c0_seq17:118-1773(+)